MLKFGFGANCFPLSLVFSDGDMNVFCFVFIFTEILSIMDEIASSNDNSHIVATVDHVNSRDIKYLQSYRMCSASIFRRFIIMLVFNFAVCLFFVVAIKSVVY